MAAAQEKREQNRAEDRDRDRTQASGPGGEKPKHARCLDAPWRRASSPALAAEITVQQLTGDSDYDEAEDPAKHIALRSAIDRLRDVWFFETPQERAISSPLDRLPAREATAASRASSP